MNKCVAEFYVSMHGTCDAALGWYEHCKPHLMSLKSAQGRASPCIFRHHESDLMVFPPWRRVCRVRERDRFGMVLRQDGGA